MTTDKKPAFGDTPLTDAQLPTFLSRAAYRAHRKAIHKEPPSSLTGSPGFRPTKTQSAQIETMTVMGLEKNEIAKILRIEVNLLEMYYWYELKTAALRANVAVGKKALELALDGQHPDMTRYWLNSRANWKETKVLEHHGADAAADAARAAREKLLAGGDLPDAPAGGAPT